jgi:hypothetical protein
VGFHYRDGGNSVTGIWLGMLRIMEQLRDIGATRKRDSPLHRLTKLPVILQQALADIARGYADDGILPGIIRRGTREKFYADQPLFQSVKVSGKRLLDNIDKELTATLTVAECSAFRYLFDALAKPVRIGLRPANSNRFLSGARRCL